jgi:Transposase DDE domain
VSQCIPGTLSRQLAGYRQRVAAAPALLEDETLSRANVMQTWQETAVKGRARLFPPYVTLWTFLLQVLSPDGSCRDAVTRLRAFQVAQGEPPCSPNTGSYCKARGRLPEDMVARLAQAAGHRLSQDAPVRWRWKGRTVKLVDGSTVSMPDTPANQVESPQQTQQQRGLGFPIARILGVFCLASGSLLTLAVGRYQGKETGELALLRQVADCLAPGDVMLGDRCYSSYFMVASLQARGVDYVGRQHQRRKADFRRGQRLGYEDHLIDWSKPARPAWLDEATYQQVPDRLQVRELRVRVSRKGFRTGVLLVVTTLLTPSAFTKEERADLYRCRWHVELDLRAIKTALGMDIVRGKTPTMVRKELWMYVLAYNLIRSVMATAAGHAGLVPRMLSFTGALQAVNIFGPALLFAAVPARAALLEALYGTISAHRVGQRPDRVEPRAVKRRPKPHPLLTIPRNQARKNVRQGQQDA